MTMGGKGKKNKGKKKTAGNAAATPGDYAGMHDVVVGRCSSLLAFVFGCVIFFTPATQKPMIFCVELNRVALLQQQRQYTPLVGLLLLGYLSTQTTVTSRYCMLLGVVFETAVPVQQRSERGLASVV